MDLGWVGCDVILSISSLPTIDNMHVVFSVNLVCKKELNLMLNVSDF